MNATGVSRACMAAALLAVLTTTGCQSAPSPAALGPRTTLAHLPAENVKTLMFEAMRVEPYVTMFGTFHDDGAKIDMWVTLDRRGNCRSKFSIDGTRNELTVVDGKGYVRVAPKAFRKQFGDGETADAIIAKTRGKWISIGAVDQDTEEFCDRRTVLDEIDEDLEDELEVGEQDWSAHGELLQLVSPGEFVYVTAEAPHRISHVVDSDSNVVKFDYTDDKPIRKPGKNRIVKIPGFSPESLPV